MLNYNVIITADLHVGVYRTYNPVPDFRLNQFDKLADKIIITAKKTDSKEVWIAGDLLVTPKAPPRVMNKLKQFFNKLVSEGLIVRFIYGNHDLLIKRLETGIEEYDKSTLLSLLHDGVNVFGYDQEVVDIVGKKVYFSSWRPRNHVEVRDADYLVCHGDVKEKISPFVPNLIDTTPYKRVISGHIHVPYDGLDFISPSSPIPHGFGDHKETSLVVFDVVNNTHTREYIHEDFLRFEYSSSPEEKIAIEAKYSELGRHVHVRVKKKSINDGITADDLKEVTMSSLDINPKKVLHTFTNKLSEGALEVINEVLNEAQVDEDELSTPDLKVDLIKVTGKNFLSIKNIDFDFSSYHGLTAIVGPNGAGKSTLFNLILFMLEGGLKGYDKADYTKINKEKFSGTLELKYNGHNYKIHRTLSSLKFWEDDVLVDSNNKSDLQKELETKLKFIRFMKLLYIKQESKGIFASMTDTNRISFLTKLIGLSLISKWTSLLNSKIKGLTSSNASRNKEVLEIKSTIDSINSFIELNRDHSSLMDSDAIDESINKVTESINNQHSRKIDLTVVADRIRRDIDGHKATEKLISDLKTKISNYQKSIESDRRVLEELVASKDEIVISDDENSSISALESKISDNSEMIKTLRARTQSYYGDLSVLKSELNHLINHPDTCPTCKQGWLISGKSARIDELRSLIDSITAKMTKSDLMITTFEESSKDCSKTIETIQLKINKLSSINSNIESRMMRIGVIEDSMKSSTDQLNSINSQVPIEELESQLNSTNSSISAINDTINMMNEQLTSLQSDKGKIEVNNKIYHELQSNKEKLVDLNKSIDSINSEITYTDRIITELDKFNSKILSDKGMLVATLLSIVADHLNGDELLKVETVERLGNGTLKPSLNIRMYVPELNSHVDYDKLSGGQRLQADLRFLSGICNTLGSISFMMLDELFKFFDDDTVIEASYILKSMNVKNIFLILHGGHENAITHSIIEARLDPSLGSLYTKLT